MSAPAAGLQNPRNAGLILGLVVGCLVYLAVVVFHPPVLCYLPQRGEWSFSPPPGVIAMRYYGMPQLGAAGFVLGWALARLRPIRRALGTPTGARGLVGAALVVLAVSLAYCLVAELTHWGAR